MRHTRKTIQKSLIFDAVTTLKCHATADQIYDLVMEKYPNISKGTVYRNLNKLADNGEIQKVVLNGGADRFDHICDKHYHTKCLICEQIFDINMEYMKNLDNSISSLNGFEIIDHDIMFNCICPKCTDTTTD